jgi:hypothetical protein
MTGMHPLLRLSLGSGRLLLPWIAVLLVSVTVAYATTTALAGSWTLSGGPEVSSSPASDELRAGPAVAKDTAVPHSLGSCPTYAGAYGWLLYDLARGGPCGIAVAGASEPSPDP